MIKNEIEGEENMLIRFVGGVLSFRIESMSGSSCVV